MRALHQGERTRADAAWSVWSCPASLFGQEEVFLALPLTATTKKVIERERREKNKQMRTVPKQREDTHTGKREGDDAQTKTADQPNMGDDKKTKIGLGWI